MRKYPYIVAEIGANHNGDMELARTLIRKAKECGADCVKFQLFGPHDLNTYDNLVELDSGTVKLENVPEWKSTELGLNSIFEQVEKFAVQQQEHIEYFKYAREVGIDYATSIFKKEDVDFCIEQKAAFIKIASCDALNLDLLEYVFSKDYPTMIAFGMSSLGEIEQVVNMIPQKTRDKVTIMHCVSLYPPKDSDVNLRFINTLQQAFGLEVGFSDHTLGTCIPLAAMTIGASVLEKHFTLDHSMPGWDHKVSANPEEMKVICEQSKRIYNAMGLGIKIVSEAEMQKRLKFRRGLVTKHAIPQGHELTHEDFVFKRPGTGIPADRLNEVIGRHVNHDIEADKTLFWEDLVK